MKYGFLIPVYNHGVTLEAVVKSLLQFNYPIIVVDDGNNDDNKAFINEVAEKYPLVTVVTHKKNYGKGRAMSSGICKAYEMGLTHVLQIDSDGQHDVSRVGYFLKKSEENPDALICGYPEYEADAPKTRVNGRKFSNGWAHIVTLSKDIVDAMIGFRVYPVGPYMKIINSPVYVDARMGVDIEILVRMYWKGVKIISEPVKVFYPKNGISNYRYFQDTVRVSFAYTRLCIGMIFRLPVLLFRKLKRK